VLLSGPLLHNGTYHLFWQNVPKSSEWSWGLGWVSTQRDDAVQQCLMTNVLIIGPEDTCPFAGHQIDR
jgi:sucrose-6-phosphate hydrolase SacC (GH32 family)